jgi:hypothetical protein
VIGTVPPRPKATVRVGGTQEFVLAANGTDLRFGWTVDGQAAGTGPRWVYAPDLSQIGRRRVEGTVVSREGRVTRAWTTRVLPPRPPRITSAEPGADRIDATAGEPLPLRLDARAATPGERLRVAWSVDGAAVAEGARFTWRPQAPGTVVVEAVVSSDLGAAVSRSWHVNVLPAPAPAPAAAARPEPPPEASRPPVPAPSPAAESRPRVVARLPAPAPPPSPALPTQEVHRWLARYAAAWRTHDVAQLRRLGQVRDEDDAEALRRYFETVNDLDVEVNLIAVRTAGDRTVVRFTRRDRFRDPAGRLVLKESPVIEKELVRTSEGLRAVRRGD